MIADSTPAWWHGCWLDSGHHLFDRDGRIVYDGGPLGARDDHHVLDAGFAPRKPRRPWRMNGVMLPDHGIAFGAMAPREMFSRIESATEEYPQGDFLLHTRAGHTIAAWWDRTQGDTRPGCNSCFIVKGGASANEILDAFPRFFPKQAAQLAKAAVALRFLRWAT